MKKILGIFALFSACVSTVSWAACPALASACAAPTRYDVKVQEVALCQDATCASNYVVGSGAKTFDISSAAVGAAIGSYAKVDAIPTGIYSYVRVVIDRSFTISTAAGPCGAALTNATVAIPQPPEIGGQDVFLNTKPTVDWNDALKTQVKVIMPLPTPIAISKGGTRPAVTVKFNTQTGVMCVNTPGPTPFPVPPDVTISVN